MSLTFYGPKDDSDEGVMGTVTMCVRDQINAATFTSAHYTDWSWAKGQRIDWHLLQGGILTLQRNEAVQRLKGDWLLFIDDDMTWESDAIEKIVKSWYELDDPLAVLGALCFRRSPPYSPTLFMREQPTSGAYNFLEDWPQGVVEVDATGCAFLLIPKTVFEKIADMPFPPYEVRRTMSRPPDFFRWQDALGEDLRFCQDAKAAGCRIFVDTRIEIGHITETLVDNRSFWASIAERPLEVEELRREINKRMDLPTLTREEARDRLGWT